MKGRLLSFVVRRAQEIAALPLALRVVLFVITVLHGVGLSWGMPNSDSWDNDGVAPRDFLPGLASTYTPGDYYTYPPFHLALLALLTAPVTIAAVVKAGSASIPVVLREIIAPPYMTAMSIVARITCLLMSLGVVLALAKITEEIAPKRYAAHAATATAVVAGVGMPFTYYSHTSNLDVPYFFWASLAALSFVRLVTRHEPRRLRRALVFCALAVATKDQAYAIFLLGAPLLLLSWLAFDHRPRQDLGSLVKELAIGSAIAIVLLLAIDGALTNPSGFRARLAFLSGSASQDYATYPATAAGRVRIAGDLVNEVGRHYPYFQAFLALYVVGFVVAVRAASSRAAALAPLLFALSFSIGFNFVARRVEERFTLPQVLFLAIYAGIAIGRVCVIERRSARWPLVALASLLCVRGLWFAIELDVNLLYDPRYAVEDHLRKHVKPGDTIEVHGLNVYLPRFPEGSHTVRLGHEPVERRSPIPGVEERQGTLSAIEERKPAWIVVSDCYTWRFFTREIGDGRMRPTAQARHAADEDAGRMFMGFIAPESHYRQILISEFESKVWKKIDLHASVSCKTRLFEREGRL